MTSAQGVWGCEELDHHFTIQVALGLLKVSYPNVFFLSCFMTDHVPLAFSRKRKWISP